ncbi:MAG: hypothetical protein HY209_07760 [Candidatus Omnitrophica bacterium]|nr:hypothetical protein [Candidatus Omnitrophota bacterium]
MQHITLAQYHNRLPCDWQAVTQEPLELVLPVERYNQLKDVIRVLFDENSVKLIRRFHRRMRRK